MSLISRSLALGRQPARLLSPAAATTRSFSASSRTSAGKETADSRDTGDIAAARESEKQQSVQDAKSGKAQWRDGLASESESSVKADRGEMKDAKSTIQELQKETAQAAQLDKNKSK